MRAGAAQRIVAPAASVIYEMKIGRHSPGAKTAGGLGMSLAEMNAQTAVFLEEVLRGSIAQNLYRMVLQQYTMNSLGRKPQISRSPQAIYGAAARVVRQQFPGFTPIARPDYRGRPAAI